MRRVFAVLGSVLFLVLAPGIVAVLLPWRISRWHIGASFLGIPSIRIVGVLLIALGAPVLLESFARFAIRGMGTPAPIFPTRHLVVSGFYRYVRNPMYIAVVSVIVGQGLITGNVRVLEYAGLVWLGFHVFVRAYEEPILRKTFAAEYDAFCDHVPRWLPRLNPWRESAKQERDRD